MLLGCRIEHDAVAVDRGKTSPAHIFAGECTGIGGGELAALTEGAIAGYAATGQRGSRAPGGAAAAVATFRHGGGKHLCDDRLNSPAKPQTILCRCEDVTLEQVSHQPGWNTAKLGSRCGMGACQGKVCATAAGQLWAGLTATACAFNAGPERKRWLRWEGGDDIIDGASLR